MIAAVGIAMAAAADGGAATLVTNTGQQSSGSTAVGVKGALNFKQEQRFTTGADANGYELAAVELFVLDFSVGDEIRVSVHAAGDDRLPAEELYVLASPAAIDGDGFYLFAAPASAGLAAATRYHVVVGAPSGGFGLGVTKSNAEDAESAPGWSIRDFTYYRAFADGSFEYRLNRSLRLSIAGRAVSGAPPQFAADRTVRTIAETAGSDGVAAAVEMGDPLTAEDPDGDTLSYSLAGAHAAKFAIDPGTGQVSTKVGANYDYEAGASLSVTARVGDGNGGTDTMEVVVELTNVAEPPKAADAPVVARVPDSTTRLDVSWTLDNVGRLPILGYDVRSREAGTNSWTYGPDNVAEPSARIADLTAGTTYEVQVLAVNNDGIGPWSESGTGSTNAGAAPPLPALTAAFEAVPSAHDGSAGFELTLRFSESLAPRSRSKLRGGAVAVSGGTLGALTRANPDRTVWTVPVQPAGTADVVVSLAAGTACDAGGVCTADGRTLSAGALATVPGPDAAEPPDQIGEPALTAATNHIDATWTEPAANGAAISGYDVEYGEPGEAWTDAGHAGTATSLRIAGLAADTAYEVRVRAVNDAGDGAWSPAAAARTLALPEPPDQIGEPALTAATNHIDATWTEPAANGAAIAGYDVEYGEPGGAWTDAGHAGTATSLRIAGLAADTAYEVRVRAVNDAGDGAWSPAASARTLAAGTAAEGDVRLVGGAGAHEGRVEVHHDGQWGTVCDDYWNAKDAEVVCRQLGYAGTATAHRGSAFGEGADPIWMDNVQCRGGEARLADCRFAGWGMHNCRHAEDAGASCATPALSAVGATLSGTRAALVYDAALDAGSVPSPRDFVVAARAADGTSAALEVAAVSMAGRTVVLTLSRPVGPGGTASLSYLPAAMRPLQDASLNAAAALTIIARPRSAPPAGAPAVVAVPRDPVAAVSGAAKVERLDLSDRGLSDLGALAGLADLELLDLGGNAVVDLWPLAGLRGLRVLDLSGNRIEDVSALAGLTGLERLDLSGNRIADIGPLAALAGLEVLLLDGNRIADPAALVPLSGLAHLGLSGNRVVDVGELAGLAGLQRLDLAGNPVADAWALGDLGGLLWLRLPGDSASDADALGRLSRLRWLWLEPHAAAPPERSGAR